MVWCWKSMKVSFSFFPYIRVVIEERWVSSWGLMLLLLMLQLRIKALTVSNVHMRYWLLCEWTEWLLDWWYLTLSNSIFLWLMLSDLLTTLLEILLSLAQPLRWIGLIAICSYAFLTWHVSWLLLCTFLFWVTAATDTFLPNFLGSCQQ